MSIQKKTKLLANAPEVETIIEGERIEWVDEVRYLGQIISFNDSRGRELSNRIRSGWGKFWSLGSVFKGNIPISTKAAVWGSCVQPSLSYGAQTWALTKSNIKRLQTTQRAMERSMIGVKERDKIKAT